MAKRVMTETITIAFFVLVAVVVVVALLSGRGTNSLSKKSIREGVGFGPMNKGSGYMAQYQFSTSAGENSDGGGTGLVRWWFGYADAMGPEVAGTAYTLCDDLQTSQSIQYYGLTQGMVDTLSKLKPALDNISPSSIRTAADVNSAFGPTCASILNSKAGWVTKSGLYDDMDMAAITPGVVDIM